jgi:beta-phosphoglucomutase
MESPKHELVVTMTSRKNDLHDILIRDEAKALPYAPEFVDALTAKGIPVAIASTAILRHIDIFLRKTQLNKHFSADRVLSYESITRPKPDPQVYNLAFESLGLAEAD